MAGDAGGPGGAAPWGGEGAESRRTARHHGCACRVASQRNSLRKVYYAFMLEQQRMRHNEMHRKNCRGPVSALLLSSYSAMQRLDAIGS
jgi:hypothetical protein